MQKNDENKKIGLIATSVLLLIAVVQFNFIRANNLAASQSDHNNDFSNDELSELDLASLSKSKISRQIELGTPKKENLKQDKEIDLLLADPAMSQKWELKSTQAQEAWAKHRATGSKNVKVCVIDTGIDVKHPDVKNNLWVNLGETGKDSDGLDKATNGKDDDGNGFVDDVHGYNFVNNNADLTDHHGHGTHIAGIIGAEGGNKIGISGVSPKVSLVIAKYYDPRSPTNNNLLNTVRAIRYCTDVGADIINYSGGGLEPSDQERNAIAQARDRGILFVAAAGNERSNSDVKKYYPANYDLDNIISVTAYDKEKNILTSSNYGSFTVDIAAPGKNLYSTLPNNSYGPMTGTSQATAVVSGVAALIRARFPDFDAARIARHITETGDLEPTKLAGKTRNQKRLNAYRALAILDQGVTVTGIIPSNQINLRSQEFTISSSNREISNASAARSTATDASDLGQFSKDLRRFLNEQSLQQHQR